MVALLMYHAPAPPRALWCRLAGVWLLARCATLSALGYDVRRLGTCIGALSALGLGTRAAALGVLLGRHRGT